MGKLEDTIKRIGPLNEGAMAAARARQDTLTKPLGSLGRLEELSIQLAGITGQARPLIRHKAIIVMAGDHGVVAEGVSAYPQEVTPQMVYNFLRGGAGINVLARHAGSRVVVVDMGVACELEPHQALVNRKVAPGTRNMALGPAMTRGEARQAVEAGIEVLEAEATKGLDIVGTGDMGIGNTTASSAITAAFTGCPVEVITGRGTGLNDEQLQRKIEVIRRALDVNRPDPADPLGVLAGVGGFEIGGLAGVILGAAANHIPVVVDGFISGAAALVACGLCSQAREYLIPAHRSVEVGHRAIFEHLALKPRLDLDLRLGEGPGAAIGGFIVEAAARVLSEMATFGEAGVAEALPEGG
ncbi:MAG: nicotinate-nucleotide--dimethylbenzimidazole phosphoribosyltransferase [Dehalococcoidia bacterium]|nr:nicotinate-nucleotide--dimethylbenzimidazole phosphoribosyltransferase [Dehalococcoidia bacterium]